MSQSSLLCPGTPYCIDDKTQEPIIHYLKIIDETTGILMCNQDGCQFMYRDKQGNDIWITGFIPPTIPKPDTIL